MMSSSFPTTLADLNFHRAPQQRQHRRRRDRPRDGDVRIDDEDEEEDENDDAAATSAYNPDDDDENDEFSLPSIYATLKSLRRSTLSIPHRLTSILADATFIQSVSSHHPTLPIIANERCGSWYIPPWLKSGSAYFKSTDGHAGQQSFSLRRLNLPVLELVGKAGGCVIVDSTRRGKSIPDALAKTVPIWCAVWNRVLFPELVEREGEAKGGWAAHRFRGPPGVGKSEVQQIERRMDGFVQGLLGLRLDFKTLRKSVGKPMRVCWVVGHDTKLMGDELDDTDGNGGEVGDDVEEAEEDEEAEGEKERISHQDSSRVILCSASRRVKGAEMSEGGYIQGAGDDSENWAHGLTPQLFWENRDLLLASPEADLPDLIQKLVADAGSAKSAMHANLIEPTSNIYIAKQQADGIDLSHHDYDLIINCCASGDYDDGAESSTRPKRLSLACREGKLGSRNLRERLGQVKSVVSPVLNQNRDCRILITCNTGKDLSVGVALVLLCTLYSDEGQIGSSEPAQQIDKLLIRQRLAWIVSSLPEASPSRSTLQAVNAFLMDRP